MFGFEQTWTSFILLCASCNTDLSMLVLLFILKNLKCSIQSVFFPVCVCVSPFL